MSDKADESSTWPPFGHNGAGPWWQLPPGYWGCPPSMFSANGMTPEQQEAMNTAAMAGQNPSINPFNVATPFPMWGMPSFGHIPTHHHAQMMAQMQHAMLMQQQYAQQLAQMQSTESTQNSAESDAQIEQAQAMLQEVLGEDAGMFNQIIGSMGMNDKEFWKGALIGAAAALVLGNENVRNKLLEMVSGAGSALKSGGGTVADAASQTASTVKENVAAGSEIMRDTYAAGREGFKESVDRHRKVAQGESASEVAFASNVSEETNQ